jgi:branched-subunit amino acid aminotransferase/4-amino-4-deoxychorismate lyase
MLEQDELRGADEAFLTSTIRGVMPVTRVDGAPIGEGRPGPITARVRALYLALVASAAAAP